MIPAVAGVSLPAMSDDAICRVRALETALRSQPQVDPQTVHCFHGGMYARTVLIPAGCALTGARIKVATLLILSGDATVFNGAVPVRLTGYHIIPGSAGRKQAICAHADTHLTMLFPTAATTVNAAEHEFTDEADALVRGDAESIIYTGE